MLLKQKQTGLPFDHPIDDMWYVNLRKDGGNCGNSSYGSPAWFMYLFRECVTVEETGTSLFCTFDDNQNDLNSDLFLLD